MKAALLHDRLNIIELQIGRAGINTLLQQIKNAGCTHVGLNQHDNGDFWGPSYVSLMAMALHTCKELGLKAIYFADDISKGARGNPAGWYVRLGKHSPQLVSRSITADITNRVFVTCNLRKEHLYQLHYKAVDSEGKPVAVKPFLHFGDDWQISKYGRSAEQRIEFIPIAGDGKYMLTFRADKPFTLKVISFRAVEKPESALGKITWLANDFDGDELDYDSYGIYHGTEGPSGHFHCQTPDLNDSGTRRAELTQTYRNFVQHYGGFICDGTIDSVFIGGDEFTACGGSWCLFVDRCVFKHRVFGELREGYGLDDLMAEIDRHSTTACALGLKCLLWARPADYQNPSRGNYPNSLVSAIGQLWRRSLNGEITPILWQESTTEEMCRADCVAVPGIAGPYLGLSNPAHFKAAGHTSFAAHWWPRDGKTWADYPIEKLTECCEVI